VSSKKQRRRREKSQRHEWEYVEIDGEGNEAPVEPAKPKKDAAVATKAKAKPEQRGGRSARPLREVKPPSWSRALKRGALFVPFLYIFLTALQHVDTLAAIGVSLLYSAVFVPMFFFVDRMAYRTYKRRLGERSS
jgi:hypothetical protein